MSLRDLVDPDCGQSNSLMRLGNHVTRDAAYKDEGIIGPFHPNLQENQFVNEFLGQMSTPQTFRMDDLLKEMRDIDTLPGVIRAPQVIDHVTSFDWATEFSKNHTDVNFTDIGKTESDIWGPVHTLPIHNPSPINWTNEFFSNNELEQNQSKEFDLIPKAAGELISNVSEDRINYSEFMKFMKNVTDGTVRIDDGQVANNLWTNEFETMLAADKPVENNNTLEDNWVDSFNNGKFAEMDNTESYNTTFWNRLQDEWKRISEQDDSGQHPWLNEFSDYYDPYKEYKFDEENHLVDIENAFEKGKLFFDQGDIPSAVLCFEAAVKQEPENAEIWELLGIAQAENEKDPNAIAAMKRSLELQPNNLKVLMALSVSYTNESIQNQALKCLINWMNCNPKYQNLVPPTLLVQKDEGSMAMASSLIRGPELKDVENLYLTAVQRNPTVIDPDIQEALGVLFNLSSEYDKAVDCFRAALQVRPDNAKTWNRLGASLANGNRSVEAVEAYKRALDIHPGYIRARYNVGIICINLKSYKEAVEHFLTALNHQATSVERSGLNITNQITNKMSDTIWSTLKMAISLLGRNELHTAIDNHDLNILNNAFNSSSE